jgi:hypothetical protein
MLLASFLQSDAGYAGKSAKLSVSYQQKAEAVDKVSSLRVPRKFSSSLEILNLGFPSSESKDFEVPRAGKQCIGGSFFLAISNRPGPKVMSSLHSALEKLGFMYD